MKDKQQLLWVVLYFFTVIALSAQVRENAIPFSVSENLHPLADFEHVFSPDSIKAELLTDSSAEISISSQFAYPIPISFNPKNSGQWTETPSGKVWRIGIHSENAYSLYVSLQFNLLPGEKLFAYAPGYENMQGGFSNRNNNEAEVLSISPIPGDKLILELNMPKEISLHGTLQLRTIYHDYRNIFQLSTQRTLKSTAQCYQDINCPNGKFWQTEKRAVVKIISDGGMGTGALVGNTNQTDIPYILTAQHLISSDEIAAEALFIFNYESEDCGEGISIKNHSISGAEVVATTDHKVDFTLLRLYTTPPFIYTPYYAGWDAQEITPQRGTSIHHSLGGLKQIAIEYHPLVHEDIGEGYNENTNWKVSHWEVGTTDAGSSGAPLFNAQHRVIGTLSGGRASCDYPKDDYFSRFDVAWDFYPDSSSQLKYWLDPAQKGQLTIDGYDPYGFNEEFCEPAWNYPAGTQLGISQDALSWGWISGHNSEGFAQFAERFEAPANLQINGMYLDVAKAYASHPLAAIEIKVWEGREYPEREYYSKLQFLSEMLPGQLNYLPFDSVLSISGTIFAGYKITYGNPSDTFAVQHTLEGTMSSTSTMYIYDNEWHRAEESLSSLTSLSLGVGLSQCYGKVLPPAAEKLKVYPNPCRNSATLEIPDGIPIQELQCIDHAGRSMPVELVQNEEGNRLYFDLNSGIYMLRIKTEEKVYNAQLVVVL